MLNQKKLSKFNVEIRKYVEIYMFFSSTKIDSTTTMTEFVPNSFIDFLITKFVRFAET